MPTPREWATDRPTAPAPRPSWISGRGRAASSSRSCPNARGLAALCLMAGLNPIRRVGPRQPVRCRAGRRLHEHLPHPGDPAGDRGVDGRGEARHHRGLYAPAPALLRPRWRRGGVRPRLSQAEIRTIPAAIGAPPMRRSRPARQTGIPSQPKWSMAIDVKRLAVIRRPSKGRPF